MLSRRLERVAETEQSKSRQIKEEFGNKGTLEKLLEGGR
jgi:hypothetical protein